MTVQIAYYCGGCDASASVSVRVEREVLSTGHMIGGVACDRVKVARPTIGGSAPEGWIAFDPYTDCTYCPECWAGIEGIVGPVELAKQAAGGDSEWGL